MPTALVAYTGTSETRSSALHVSEVAGDTDATFRKLAWAPKPFEDAPYYGLRVRHRWQRSAHLGISVDFTHYKMYADTDRVAAVSGVWNGAAVQANEPIRLRVGDLEISHGVNLAAVNLEYHFGARGASPPRWQPYVGAGVGVYFPHAEGTIDGASVSGDYQFAGWGYQVIAGTERQLSSHLGVLVEAKFDAGTLDIDLAPGARVETDTRTLHLLIGVLWFP